MKSVIKRLILEYLRFFARCALLRNRPTIIGITGSAGKTSTRDAVYAVLKDHFKTHVIRKGNSETGVPLGILGLNVHSLGFDSLHKSVIDWAQLLIKAPRSLSFPQQFDYMIVEMGVDDPYPPQNMEYLLSIVQPDIAIVLNAYATHGAQFEKVVTRPITTEKVAQAIAYEKVKLVTHNPRCKFVIYNKDNETITKFLDDMTIDSVKYGEAAQNHISYVDHDVTPDRTIFSYLVGAKTPLKLEIKDFVLPIVFREVFAAAILVGEYVGLDLTTIKSSLEKNFSLEPGRSTILAGVKDSLIIDSSYNASRESVMALLELMRKLKTLTKRPFVFVCGDMRELGKATAQEHAFIADMLPGLVDYVYTVGPLSRKYVYEPLHNKRSFEEIKAFDTAHEVGKHLKENLPKEALILFKGSQNTIFLEEAIKYILHDASDSSKLPRQEDYWMHKKHSQYISH